VDDVWSVIHMPLEPSPPRELGWQFCTTMVLRSCLLCPPHMRRGQPRDSGVPQATPSLRPATAQGGMVFSSSDSREPQLLWQSDSADSHNLYVERRPQAACLSAGLSSHCSYCAQHNSGYLDATVSAHLEASGGTQLQPELPCS
jgi:hypothetical protein